VYEKVKEVRKTAILDLYLNEKKILAKPQKYLHLGIRD